MDARAILKMSAMKNSERRKIRISVTQLVIDFTLKYVFLKVRNLDKLVTNMLFAKQNRLGRSWSLEHVPTFPSAPKLLRTLLSLQQLDRFAPTRVVWFWIICIHKQKHGLLVYINVMSLCMWFDWIHTGRSCWYNQSSTILKRTQ